MLVVQGGEAGGHRGGTADAPEDTVGLIALLQLITARVATPVVALWAGCLRFRDELRAERAAGAPSSALGIISSRKIKSRGTCGAPVAGQTQTLEQ